MDAKITGNLGDILLREGLITSEQLEAADREKLNSGKSLARVLVEMGLISEKVKLGILQKKLGVDIISLRNFRLDPALAKRIPRGLAVRHSAIPVRVEPDGLLIAMDDPSDLEAVDKLSAVAGMKIRTVLAPCKEIDQFLEDYPAEVVEAEPIVPSKTLLRFFRGLTFWVFLLAPVVVFGIALAKISGFQSWLSKKNLSEFDFALYMIILYGTWSVVVYYIHDVVFTWILGEEEEAEASNKDNKV